MTEMLNKTMLDSWRKYWGTNDDDIPGRNPLSIQVCFNVMSAEP